MGSEPSWICCMSYETFFLTAYSNKELLWKSLSKSLIETKCLMKAEEWKKKPGCANSQG